MSLLAWSVVGLVALAWVFDYTNGFHDAANSISTIVATRVLTPKQAVMWAAFFNFIAFVIFHTAVANTVGQTVAPKIVGPAVIFAGLVGAIAWNLMTWWKGLPTSSTHALVGAFAGAGIAKAGIHALEISSVEKTLVFIVVSPLAGIVLAYLLLLTLTWVVRRREPRRVQDHFRHLQLLSAAAVSLGHGGNDAQKTMGIIAALLVSTGYLHGATADHLPVPFWVVLLAHSALALGTMSGGWRIVRTLGGRLTDLKPISGFSAETAAGVALIGSTLLGVPVSTTHVVTGAISGVGMVQRRSAVRWPLAAKIVWSWILTLPVAAAMGAVAYRLTTLPDPRLSAAAVIAVFALVGAAILVRTRRTRASARAEHNRLTKGYRDSAHEEPAAA